MTYPQPSSVGALVGGQQFFRLFTELESAGDIYESEVSALGFSMGPDSDLANVRISYFDSITDTGVGNLVLSPDRNFVGRVDARPADKYIKSVTRKGRILISPIDTYAPDIFAALFDPQQLAVIRPKLDVLQYFGTLPSVIPQRSDRTFKFTSLKAAGDPSTGTTAVAFPSYGRKSGFLSFFNRTGTPFTVTLTGVNFSLSAISNNPYGTFEELYTHEMGTIDSEQFQFKASQHGIWDYFYLSIGPANAGADTYTGGQFYCTVQLSDDEA